MNQPAWRLMQEGGLVWLSFDGWDGVRCGFSTRLGGVSSPPFHTLNLSESVGDLAERVKKNRERFGAVTGYNPSEVILSHQTHSDKLNLVRRGDHDYEGDALLSQQEGISLGVSVADCLPIYVYDRARGAIGIVHAGRRGTLKRIARKAVVWMTEALRTRPEECSLLFGPAIGPCCYEVGPAIAERFQEEFPGSVLSTNEVHNSATLNSPGTERPLRSHFFLDLPRANELQLEEIGVKEIIRSGFCTSCRGDLFFSHRRDGGRTGRMMAIIGKRKH